MLLEDPHYSERHWQFVQSSLEDIDREVEKHNTQVLVTYGATLHVFDAIRRLYEDVSLSSHEETGIKLTYDRDLEMLDYCKEQNISWVEYQSNGIIRGKRNRKNWTKSWYAYMSSARLDVNLYKINWLTKRDISKLKSKIGRPMTRSFLGGSSWQRGGRSEGLQYLDSFVQTRVYDYARGISKPGLSRTSCSRLSPYIAWGNISIKEAYQSGMEAKEQSAKKKVFQAFLSRLRWHCHFIQKFDMECEMEFLSYNRAYRHLDQPINEVFLEAWKQGMTGYPLVDASMRCLKATGYLNFRMRAMLVSFLTHHLWQPWQSASHHLASIFLDFEPGIHYPQLQMQAGVTGTNTLRIYNPIKQSYDHDAEGSFIKEWVPELSAISSVHIHEPWKMTLLEQAFTKVEIGKDYPSPIVDIAETGRYAREVLWSFRKRKDVRAEARRIVEKHTIGGLSRPNH